MRGRTRITGIMTAILMAGVMAGCSVQAGKQVEPTTGKQQTKETVQETVQETELQKPTHPAPSQIQPFPDVEKETKAEPLIGGKRIILMTDIHYLAQSLTDRGDMFQSMVEHGDGKLTNYVWEITDAALEEIKLLSPDALIISGDLSLQGEKKSHEELAKSWMRWRKPASRFWSYRATTTLTTQAPPCIPGETGTRRNLPHRRILSAFIRNSDTRRPAAGMPIPSVTPMTWVRPCACSCWIPASMNPATR